MSETHEESLSALLHETRTFPPPEDLAKEANAQPGIYAEADRIRSPSGRRRPGDSTGPSPGPRCSSGTCPSPSGSSAAR